MTTVTRLITHVDLDPDPDTGGRRSARTRSISLSARLTAALADGRGLTLLDDRGWTSTLHGADADGEADLLAWLSIEEIEEIEDTARTVVGPDEPDDGMTEEQTAASHWAYLAAILARHGVTADPGTLAELPHDVRFGQRLAALVARSPRA